MIPKILHQLNFSFVPGAAQQLLTWEERQLANKARALMPDWQYRLWTDAPGLALVKRYFPDYVDDYLNLPAPVIRVDIARCLFLYHYGGVYFDTDYRFFRPLDSRLLSHRCILGEEIDVVTSGTPKLGNAFIGSAARLPLWLDFVDHVFDRIRSGRRKATITEDGVLNLSGPDALTRFVKNNADYTDIVKILPQNVLFPAFAKFKLTGKRDTDTIGVHLCWGSWRNKPLPQQVKNRARRILSAI